MPLEAGDLRESCEGRTQIAGVHCLIDRVVAFFSESLLEGFLIDEVYFITLVETNSSHLPRRFSEI